MHSPCTSEKSRDQEFFEVHRKGKKMTTIRVSKNKENPYIIVKKSSIHDPNLSLRAKGLLTFLLGFPDDWQIQLNHLVNVLKEGRAAIRCAIKELQDNNYIHKQKIKNDKGRYNGWEYILYEEPFSPRCDFLTSEKPTSENRTLLNNNILLNNKLTKTPTPLKRGISSSQKQKLEEDFEEVWKEWPVKRSKEASKRAYIKARQSTTGGTIKNAVQAYKREIEALAEKRKSDKRILVPNYAHFSSWLNGCRWNDEYESSKTTNEADIKKIVEQDIESKKDIAVEGLSTQTWQAILKKMATTLGVNTYRSWFMKITPVQFKAGCLYLQAENKFVCDWVRSKYDSDLKEAIESIIPGSKGYQLA